MSILKSLAIILLGTQLVLAAPSVNAEETVVTTSMPLRRGEDTNLSCATNCESAASAGLGRLLCEAKSLLPLRQIQQIVVDSAANDEQVSALIALQRSAPVRQRLATIKQSLEYRKLSEYTCKQLQLDARQMGRFVKNFISITKEKVKPSEGEFKGRPGIRGLLQDIRSILPRQKLRELYKQLLKEDPQLSMAIQRIKSSEFRQLLRDVRLLPEALELREELLNVGVPLLELKDLVSVALGVSGDEFGDNVHKLKFMWNGRFGSAIRV